MTSSVNNEVLSVLPRLVLALLILVQTQGLRSEKQETSKLPHSHEGHRWKHRHAHGQHASAVNLAARPASTAARSARIAKTKEDGHDGEETESSRAGVSYQVVHDESGETSHEYPDRRTDLCERVKDYQSNADGVGGSQILSSALGGTEISVALFDYPESDEHMYSYDQETGKWSGWMISIMDAVAKKGGFKYAVYSVGFNESTSWTVDINKVLSHHDVLLTWTLSTFERTNLGIHMPYGLLDASSQLVTRETMKKESLMDLVFMFLRPFKTGVWMAFLAICALTGIVYFVVEKGKNDDDVPDDGGVKQATFLAYLQVTGGGGYAPQTWPGKLILISWAWMILLFTAAYTANLASFLVVKNTGSTTVQNLQEAMAQNMDICAMGRSAVWEKLTDEYPDYNHFVPVETSAIGGMHSGKCDAALSLSFNTDFARGDEKLNSKCDLKQVGGNQDSMLAGWSVKDDFVGKCTVLVTQVLEAILQDLAQDGTLKKLYRQLLNQKKTRQGCPAMNKEDDDGRMGITSMVGMFGIHAVCCAIALLLWMVWKDKNPAATNEEA